MLLSVLFSTQLSAQSKKLFIDNKIKSQTVYEYFLDEDADKAIVELIETYNAAGELTEIKQFRSNGEIKRWEKYKFNENGDLIEEIILNEKGKVDKIEKTIYKDGLRVEKQFFNPKGKLYKKKTYIYEYRK